MVTLSYMDLAQDTVLLMLCVYYSILKLHPSVKNLTDKYETFPEGRTNHILHESSIFIIKGEVVDWSPCNIFLEEKYSQEWYKPSQELQKFL